jgi:hypothetical protein
VRAAGIVGFPFQLRARALVAVAMLFVAWVALTWLAVTPRRQDPAATVGTAIKSSASNTRPQQAPAAVVASRVHKRPFGSDITNSPRSGVRRKRSAYHKAPDWKDADKDSCSV